MREKQFQLSAVVPLFSAVLFFPALAGAAQPITLEEAINLALERSPYLAAGQAAVLAADSRVEQADLLPNPEIGLEVENFAGSGELSGFDSAETTFLLTQRLELGGKRGRRRDVAHAERTVIGHEQQNVRLDLVARTTGDFYRLLAAQQRLQLAEDLLGLSERLADTVDARVAAGKVSPVESSRARIPVVMTRVEVERAARELDAARSRLESAWGGDARDLLAEGDLSLIDLPPPLETLVDAALSTPEMQRLAGLVQRDAHEQRYQQSLRVPDLVLGAGTRRFAESDERAWMAGVTLAIPVFDRNQGARQASEYELQRSRHLVVAAENDLRAEVASAAARVRASFTEASLIGGEAIPAARASLTATEVGYREGKFELLAVLDSQRAFFEARLLHIAALESFHIERAELERLVGGPLALVDHSAPWAPAATESRNSP